MRKRKKKFSAEGKKSFLLRKTFFRKNTFFFANSFFSRISKQRVELNENEEVEKSFPSNQRKRNEDMKQFSRKRKFA